MLDALRLAAGSLTVLPVRMPHRVDREVWRVAIVLAPLVGLALGGVAWVIAWGVGEASGSSLLAAVSVVATLALLTRGLHLDGLADVADGLGSRQAPEPARAIMRQPDIGPFGVVTLLVVLLTQVSVLQLLFASSDDAVTAVVLVGAVVVSRAVITWTCRRSVPSAPDGLASQVVGTVPVTVAAGIAIASIVAVTAVGTLVDATLGGHLLAAAAVTYAGAELWWRHCARRLGAVTGDVLGSVEELATTTFLVVVALLM